ncbi:MAG: hypothetical protein MRERV_1c108 [Mycoplasmataceae bacterium RV_VA103A]|nr:MAG: hypothetical protein MRERV_10c002 [Mycoplasmataceae bacterium RV_VA103A]KLL05419.1 MAG: hypothetical protein MRERV_1c108 [Mycoplasmataceae bacterium RV_VA103A]
MDCTAQTQQWFYLCLALCGVILAMLAMFFGYNLTLDGRTTKLEKKNGKEQKQIDDLKKEVEELKSKNGNTKY